MIAQVNEDFQMVAGECYLTHDEGGNSSLRLGELGDIDRGSADVLVGLMWGLMWRLPAGAGTLKFLIGLANHNQRADEFVTYVAYRLKGVAIFFERGQFAPQPAHDGFKGAWVVIERGFSE